MYKKRIEEIKEIINKALAAIRGWRDKKRRKRNDKEATRQSFRYYRNEITLMRKQVDDYAARCEKYRKEAEGLRDDAIKYKNTVVYLTGLLDEYER